MDILPEWESIDPAQLQGIVMVVGGSDVGKTTFSRYLYSRLKRTTKAVAYLDGDPGQGRLGPPTTMTLTSQQLDEEPFQSKDPVWRT